MSRKLYRNGHSPQYSDYEANSAREALACWSEHGPEIASLLADMIIPGGVSGRELARQLKTQPQPKCYFLHWLQCTTEGKDTSFFQDTNDILQKPCSTRDVITTIRKCLNDRGTS